MKTAASLILHCILGVSLAGFAVTSAQEGSFQQIAENVRTQASQLIQQGKGREALALAERFSAAIAAEKGENSAEMIEGLQVMADAAMAVGDAVAAENAVQTKIKILSAALGPDHLNMTRSHLELGDIFGATGRDKQALAHLEEALRIQAKGTEDAAVVHLRLGRFHSKREQHTEALPHFQQCLVIMEKSAATNPKSIIEPLKEAGFSLESLGRIPEAREMLEKAFSQAEKVAGPEKEDALITANELARFLLDHGDPVKAKELYLRVSKGTPEVVPPTQALIARLHAAVATAYAGDVKTGVTEMETAIKEGLQRFPERKDIHLSLFKSAGTALVEVGLNAPALSVLKEAWKLTIELKEVEDQCVIASKFGELLRETGDHDAAAEVLKTGLEQSRKHFGPEHPRTGILLASTGSLLLSRHQLGEARKAYQEALQISAKMNGETHGQTIRVRGFIAMVDMEAGRLDQAITELEKCVAIEANAYGPDHLSTIHTTHNLAEALSRAGRMARAVSLFQQVIESLERRHPQHPLAATAQLNTGNLHMALGDPARAILHYEYAIRLADQRLGLTSSNAIQARIGMANALINTSQPAMALTTLDELTGRLDSAPAFLKRNLDTARGLALMDLGRHDEAKPALEAAMSATRQLYPAGGPALIRPLGNLIGCARMSTDIAAARPLVEELTKLLDHASPGADYGGDITLNLALYHLDAGDVELAKKVYDRSQTSWQAHLLTVFSFGSEEQRLRALNLGGHCGFLATTGQTAELATLIARTKGLVLESTVADAAMPASPAVSKVKELRQALSLAVMAHDLSASQDKSTDRTGDLARQLEKAEQALATETGTAAALTTKALTTTLDQVRAKLPAEAIFIDLIHYSRYTTPGRWTPAYGCIVLKPQGEAEWLHLGDEAALKKPVADLYQAIEAVEVASLETRPEAEKALEAAGRALARLWWEPIAKRFPVSDGRRPLICLSADGIAHRIPFAALPVESGFVSQQVDLRHFISARDLLRENPVPTNAHSAVIFGNPDLGPAPKKLSAGEPPKTAFQTSLASLNLAGILDLTSATVETTELAERARKAGWTVELAQGAEATDTRLFKTRSPTLLHIAAHGLDLLTLTSDKAPIGKLVHDPMQASLLLLAGARPSLAEWQAGRQRDPATDGILTAREAAALQLKDTLLVTASSCWSGSGGLRSGEGVMGLRRAFAQAGARHSLLALWAIDDDTARDMMGSFYERVFSGQTPPSAWSATQVEWLSELAKKYSPGLALYLAGPMALSSSCPP